MYRRQSLLRLLQRPSNGNTRNRWMMILACTMTTILFLLFLERNSLLHSRPTPQGQTLADTTVDWVVSKSVTVAKDPLVEDPERSVVDTEELKDKEIDLKEREEETRVKEEMEDGGAKDELQENELEEGNWKGLRLGEEDTNMDDETAKEGEEDSSKLS